MSGNSTFHSTDSPRSQRQLAAGPCWRSSLHLTTRSNYWTWFDFKSWSSLLCLICETTASLRCRQNWGIWGSSETCSWREIRSATHDQRFFPKEPLHCWSFWETAFHTDWHWRVIVYFKPQADKVPSSTVAHFILAPAFSSVRLFELFAFFFHWFFDLHFIWSDWQCIFRHMLRLIYSVKHRFPLSFFKVILHLLVCNLSTSLRHFVEEICFSSKRSQKNLGNELAGLLLSWLKVELTLMPANCPQLASIELEKGLVCN